MGFYRGYITHNYHMFTFAAMMRGQGALAAKTMDEGISIIPADFAKEFAPFVDPFVVMPLQVRVRFGKWAEVLAAPDYPEYFPISRTMRHGARAVAYAATGKVEEAKAEQAAFEEMRKAIPAEATFGNNAAAQILDVDSHLVAGEVFLAEKQTEDSIAELEKAVAAEDQVRYDEPPDWIQPVRHTLGAVLVQAGRFSDAVAVYQRDLKDHPNNGWALKGLAMAYRGMGDAKQADSFEAAFRAAWKDADTAIFSSCLCVKNGG